MGLSRDTLRFHEKRGLLRARRGANGYRDYPAEAADWLRYLRTAQQLGFTLAEIEADMPLLASADEPATAELLRPALARKLIDIDARIAGLTQLRCELVRRLEPQAAACPLRGDAGAARSLTAVAAVAGRGRRASPSEKQKPPVLGSRRFDLGQNQAYLAALRRRRKPIRPRPASSMA